MIFERTSSSQVSLAEWGSFNTVDTVIDLSYGTSDFSFLIFQIGNSSGYDKPLLWVNRATPSSTAVFLLKSNLTGAVFGLKFISNTQIKIVSITGNAQDGIRQVYGVRV